LRTAPGQFRDNGQFRIQSLDNLVDKPRTALYREGKSMIFISNPYTASFLSSEMSQKQPIITDNQSHAKVMGCDQTHQILTVKHNAKKRTPC
jgi:hypothetical protein